MKKMSGNDFLVVRNITTNEVQIISIEKHAFLGNAEETLVAQLDISAIDLVTTKINNKQELLNLLIGKGLVKSIYDDVYIVHCCKETKNVHSNSKRKLSFLEVIYEEDLENDDIYMLKDIANKRLFGESKVMDSSNKKINSYAGKLIKRVFPDAREASETFSYSGSILSKIKEADLGISWSLKSYVSAKDMYTKENKKEEIVKRLCNYRTLRDVIMAEKKQRDEQNGNYYSFPNSRIINMRMEAKYPLLVFVANKVNEYKNYDLSKLYTESEFALLKSASLNSTNNDINIINSKQITTDNLVDNKQNLGIGAFDLNGYIDMSKVGEQKKVYKDNDEEVVFSYIDDELSKCDDFIKAPNLIEPISNEEDQVENYKTKKFFSIEEDDSKDEEPFQYCDLDDLSYDEIMERASTKVK